MLKSRIQGGMVPPISPPMGASTSGVYDADRDNSRYPISSEALKRQDEQEKPNDLSVV